MEVQLRTKELKQKLIEFKTKELIKMNHLSSLDTHLGFLLDTQLTLYPERKAN